MARIDPFTAGHAQLVEAVLADFATRANLTPRQKGAWDKQPDAVLAAIVYMNQRLEGVAPSARNAELKAAEDEGVIKLNGKGAMARYELVPYSWERKQLRAEREGS